MGKKVNFEFQKGLEKKRILSFSGGRSLIKQELQAAKADLEEAVNRLENNKFKYATIMAYYSMFHSARALIYAKNYREKSHYYLLVAIKALYVEEGLLEEDMLNEFHSSMILREDADYHSDFSQEGAESTVSSAKKFLEKVKKLV